jgi:flagellar biosynthetic protein FliO
VVTWVLAATALASPAAPAEGLPSTQIGSALLQMLVALALVCGLAVVLLRFGLRRFYPGAGKGPSELQLVARLPLEPRRSVYVIEASGRRFLVGAADSALTLLAELTPASAGKSFQEILAVETPPAAAAATAAAEAEAGPAAAAKGEAR